MSIWKKLFSRSDTTTQVKFKREVRKQQPMMPNIQTTTRTYSAPDRETAVAFLRKQHITEPFFYVEVVTPSGIFGIDKMGEIYDSGGELPGDSSALLSTPPGSLLTEDGLWRTGDLRVKRDGEDFHISLVDKTLVKTFRAKFPGKSDVISGERALIIAHVFAALDGALEAWKLAEPTAWPESARREAKALVRICSRLGGNTRPIDFFCDPQQIRDVAASFVDVLRNHPDIRPKFGSGFFTVYNVTIRFGNALGCGGAVSAVANLYG